MIDWARVRELKDEVGADAFDEVVELFLEEVEEVIVRLQGGDRSQLETGSALSQGQRAEPRVPAIFGSLHGRRTPLLRRSGRHS